MCDVEYFDNHIRVKLYGELVLVLQHYMDFQTAQVEIERDMGFYIFVMFSTFRDEMQYIFLEKNFIFMFFLAVKDVGTDVI